MNDKPVEYGELGRRIRLALDRGCSDLDDRALARLHASRQLALARHRDSAGLRFAGLRNFGLEVIMPHVRAWAAVSALMLGMIGTYYWNAYQDADDLAEVDSALLSDDLPVAAYTDQGFRTWLEVSSLSSQ